VTDKKRQQIKSKVKKGEARVRARERTLPQRAAEVRDSATSFAKENPLLVIGGGLALGVAVSMLFRRPREVGEKAAKRASKKASGLAMLAAEVALPFIQQAMASAGEAGRAGIDRVEELGETAAERARAARQASAERAGETVDAAQDMTRGAGRRIAKAIRLRAH
jgi:ElaB/YqjD/DUF883 family membrane-anchored ribosome-binding protein